MTNELEKQFFDTFGIEPLIKNISCSECEFNLEECGCFYCDRETYPQITDHILLELFDILRKYYDLDFWTIDNSFVMDMRDKQASYTNIIYRTGGDFKNSILTSLNLIVKNRLISNDKIKHQVRTLFEEE